MYLDHVSNKERLIFTERRHSRKKLLLPLILLALILYFVVLPAWGEVIRGVNKQGAYVCWTKQGPLLRFCIVMTNERR